MVDVRKSMEQCEKIELGPDEEMGAPLNLFQASVIVLYIEKLMQTCLLALSLREWKWEQREAHWE